MSKPHKHAELIKAWADGAEIQYFNIAQGKFVDCVGRPAWTVENIYRIKPEPKPDEVKYAYVGYDGEYVHHISGVYTVLTNKDTFQDRGYSYAVCGVIKLTFDGETGKLKNAEVL